MNTNLSVCIYCEKSDKETPLIHFTYQNKEFSICPQHLPVLIHKPERLADKLPGIQPIPDDHEHFH